MPRTRVWRACTHMLHPCVHCTRTRPCYFTTTFTATYLHLRHPRTPHRSLYDRPRRSPAGNPALNLRRARGASQSVLIDLPSPPCLCRQEDQKLSKDSPLQRLSQTIDIYYIPYPGHSPQLLTSPGTISMYVLSLGGFFLVCIADCGLGTTYCHTKIRFS